jgi:hypothetical protein
MSVPVWVAELAAIFWSRAKKQEPFPRNLCKAIARAVPVTVVLLPRLTIVTALRWLKDIGIICELGARERRLRACLIARYGAGVVLIDGSDSDAEQRFSIAHELAHFLRDYWRVRVPVKKRLGVAVLEVMDGERPPTPQERLHALLRNSPIGFHVHLMERDGEGRPMSSEAVDAEESADRLAYELLAPAEHVLADAAAQGGRRLAERLQVHYGLPRLQATRYARILLPRPNTDPLLLRLRTVM